MLGEGGPEAERVELLTALAGAQAATGQFADARAALLEALELLPEDETATRLQLTVACAGMEQLLGRHDEAHARLVGALEGLDDPASPEAAALMITLAMDAFYRQARADSRTGARVRWQWRGRSGDEPLIAAALAALALACAFEGALGDARAHRAEAAALIDAMPDDKLAIRLDAIAYLTGAELYMDLFDESAAHGRAGPRRRTRDRAGIPRAHAHAGDGLDDQHPGRARWRQPSCWTGRSRPRDSPATIRRSRGIS